MPREVFTTGGDFLPKGNLYDQDPFKPIFELSQTTGISVPNIRNIVLPPAWAVEKSAQKRGLTLNDYPVKKISELIAANKGHLKQRFYLPVQREGISGDVYWQSIAVALEKFAGYPLWFDYLQGHQTQNGFPGEPLFRMDGELKKTRLQTYDFDPALIYPVWLKKELIRRERSKELAKRQVLLGIEEILPYSFASGAELPDSLSSRGSNKGRRWRMLIATNIRPEPARSNQVNSPVEM